ncbi:hypothetical protein [Halalkalicoccus salilacus]|uniref:hypothetical protein n=1 Tax=Halalkalicoccus salilacus TaxID=3117459 RepID=UPI00300EAA00
MPHSRVALSDQGDSIHADTAKTAIDIVPPTIKIDLGIDPVAYHYESWSEMADGWVESLRSITETIPDPDQDQIRNVTPLVPLSEVEALVEQLVGAGEVALPHEPTATTEDMSSR